MIGHINEKGIEEWEPVDTDHGSTSSRSTALTFSTLNQLVDGLKARYELLTKANTAGLDAQDQGLTGPPTPEAVGEY